MKLNIDTHNADKAMNILFSPPDISDIEIDEVVDTLRSGWRAKDNRDNH